MQYNAINTMQCKGKNMKKEDLTKEEQKEGGAGGGPGECQFVFPHRRNQTLKSKPALAKEKRIGL